MPRSAWLGVGATLGALAVAGGDRRNIALALAGSAVAVVAAGWPLARHRGRVFALVVGLFAILIRGIAGPPSADLAGRPDGSGPWTLAVESVGSPREGHQVATLRTTEATRAGFRVAATLPRYPPIEPGDVVEVEGRVRPRPDGAFGQYLERIGAWGTLDARTLLLGDRPSGPGTVLESIRRGAGDLLTRVLPEPEAGLAAGILIGLRDRVDRDVATAFTTAGVSHVVAISGWNIAIVAAAIAAVAGRLGRRRRAIATAIAIAAYIVFAGASASVLRAGAMAGVVLLARETGRAGRAAAALGWTAALLLFADPRLVLDAGFQLSTLATAGLIAWATPLTDRLDRSAGGRMPRWLADSLGVSLAAQAATTPIVLLSFGRLAIIAPAVNLLVVPLVAPAMAAGCLALLGGMLVGAGGPATIGLILAAPGWVALRTMVGIVELAASLPLASLSVDPPAGALLTIASSTAIAALLVWRRQRRHTTRAAPLERTVVAGRATTALPIRIATAALIVAVTMAGAVALSRPTGVARVTVLDVGQGDAILIEGSRGGRLLVDGGPDPDRLLVELDRRLPPWDRRLDVVILSHPHEDHVAGLALLIDRYRVGRVFEPGMRGPGPGYAAWTARLGRLARTAHLSIAAGDRLTIDDIGLRVLWPVRGQVPAEPTDTGTGINNVSVVLLGSVGKRRFLLAGDVEEEIDPTLLAAGLPRVDLLKVAHHGSRTATTEPFVETVRPRVAVASAGAGNPYGHPARSTLDRLAAAGARVFRTDQDGSVAVAFGAAGMNVTTAPPRPSAETRTETATTAARLAIARPRAFLCAVPIQPFVAPRDEPPPASPAVAVRPTPTLGYHPADDDHDPGRGRCPALPPAIAAERRNPASLGRGRHR